MIIFSDLVGQVITSFTINDTEDVILISTQSGNHYKMYHDQECCGSVTVDDVCGDLDDIIGKVILVAEESTSNSYDNLYESQTWTFYKIDTSKGGITIRWYGNFNGYYSESVEFTKC